MKIFTFLFTFISTAALGQSPLVIPPLLTGTNFNLTLQTGTYEFFPGISTPTYGINGDILGPTLLMNKGDMISINVNNTLGTSTTIHWHGLHIPAIMDGGPHQVIANNGTWSPQFEMKNTAGTYWYHPHGEGKTDLHVSKGLAGLIIVKDSIESALQLPRMYGIDDIPLVLQTKAFDVFNQIAIASMFDTVVMVNATRDAYQSVPAQVVRLRLLNGASARSFNIGLSNGMNFHQIATDAGLLTAPVSLNRLVLSPGERAEILLDLSAMLGDSIFLMSYGSELPNGIMGSAFVGNGMASLPDYDQNPLNGADFSLLQLIVTNPTANPITTIPSVLTPQTPWLEADADESRTISFMPEVMGPVGMVEGPFVINGAMYDPGVTNITTYLDNIEVWTLTNQTSVAHPFHIHDVHFYILDINGGPVPAHLQGKKDVVLVMPMETVKFILKFENFADSMMHYMYHCHVLHHEDDGMMGQFLVLNTNVATSAINTNGTLAVFPNPCTDVIHIQHSTANIQNIVVYDIYGKMLLQLSANESLVSVDVSALPAGMYIIETQHSKGFSREKVIKDF